jgi:hypothetical protein
LLVETSFVGHPENFLSGCLVLVLHDDAKTTC